MEKSKKRSAASLKLGAAEVTNRDKLVGAGDRLDKSQQSSRAQVSKLHPVSVMKRKFQKTAGGPSPSPGQKVSSVYNLRSKIQITEGAPGYNLRSKAQKTENQDASTNTQKRKIPNKDGFKDSSVASHKREIFKNFAQPTKKIEATKPINAFMADLDKKNHPLTSQYEPFVCEPFYHIRWEGDDAENGPLGQKCIICNKDLSGATEDDDDSEDNDDYHYEDDDYYEDDDEYYDDINPPLLPAVDILSCGHAYHTECLQKGTPVEGSSDPNCVLCSKMA